MLNRLGCHFACWVLLYAGGTSVGWAATNASDLSAEEILEKHVTALGGRPALQKLSSRSSKGVYTGSHTRFYGVDELPFESFFQGHNQWTRLWPSSNITETIVEDDGWRHYPQFGARGLRSMGVREREFLRRDLLLEAHARWKDLWDVVESLGKKQLEGEEVWAVRLTLSEPPLSAVRYFDAESLLLVRSEVTLETGEMVVLYQDYRSSDGVRIPHRIEVKQGQDHHVFQTEKVSHNTPIEASRFAKP